MANYTDLFPKIYKDETGNLQLDENNVQISGSTLVTSRTEANVNNPAIFNSTQKYEDNAFFKIQDVSDGSDVPNGFAALGFDNNAPYFSSPNFPGGPRFLNFNTTVLASEDTQLQVGDQFFLIGGTVDDPIILTMPTSPYVFNTVIYAGGLAGTFGSLQSPQADIVFLLRKTSEEIGRGNVLPLNVGSNLTFAYSIVSSDPLVAQWTTLVGGN